MVYDNRREKTLLRKPSQRNHTTPGLKNASRLLKEPNFPLQNQHDFGGH